VKKAVSFITNQYFNERLDFRTQIFNTLALLWIAVGIVSAVFGAVSHAVTITIVIDMLTAVMALVLLCVANRTGKFRACFLIMLVVLFFILFPILFFIRGGYLGGMPSFFVFAVVFTIIMLEWRKRLLVTTFLIIFYLGCFLIAYFYPETVTAFATVEDAVLDVIGRCVIASITLAVVIHQHLIIYDRKMKQLEQLDRGRAELFSNISHEMKTPLTVISTYAQLLKNKLELLPEAQDAVEDSLLITSEANQLGLIVSQALEFSRTTEGTLIQEIKPCHIGEIITESISSHFSGASGGNNYNRIDLKIDEGLPPILADAARVRQVVVNLVSNAVRHTKGGIITISASLREKSVVLSVTDNGEGIPEEEIPMIFERWYTGAGNVGSGLGLYICKQIVEAHNGKITTQSELGKGTCFTVFLPIA